MKNFIKTVLAVIVGIILSSILFFFFMIMMIGIMASAGKKPVIVAENSVLVLRTGVQIPDRGNPYPFFALGLTDMSLTPTTGLNDILSNLKKAADDPKIKGVIIENDVVPTGWATASELRQALINFRESGKFVISYTDYALTQESYYISTAADRIYLNPEANIQLQGLSSEVMFYKKALDKLGVEIQVIRHGKFKGAVEPFMLDRLSPENRQQITSFTSSIWNHVVEGISESRGLTKEEVNRIADRVLMEPAEALDLQLIDGLIYRDSFLDTLRSLCGQKPTDKVNTIQMSRYTKVPEHKTKTHTKDKIAIIYAEGSIVTGKGTGKNIGGSSLSETIREARTDSTVRAVIFRVNSPGGNATASDLIWREISLCAGIKPVVVSMGNYAASGGYYISAAANRIICNPATITGSIGVFGLIPNAGKLMNDKLGLTTDVVKTNVHADAIPLSRAMTSYEQKLIQDEIERVYATFVSHVASGRNMEWNAVDEIGQGRVWSGSEALGNGLADMAGGLEDAVREAAGMAGITEYSIKEMPELPDPYTRFLKELSGDAELRLIGKQPGEFATLLKQIKEISEMTGVQARLPYILIIR